MGDSRVVDGEASAVLVGITFNIFERDTGIRLAPENISKNGNETKKTRRGL